MSPPLLRAAAAAAVVLLGTTALRAAVHHRAPTSTSNSTSSSTSTPSSTSTGTSSSLDGELRFAVTRAALLPTNADAPGTDSPIAGRPSEATRLLDTAVDANGSRLRVYATPAPASALEPALARAIVGRGFARTPGVDPSTVTFARAHDFVILRFATREERTIVSIVELGFRSAGDPQ